MIAIDDAGALVRPNRHLDAYVQSELAPCGDAGGLSILNPSRSEHSPPPDVTDCLVTRYRPWLLTIWEPLVTKAPSPANARPHCCYIHTVIFYDAAYRFEPALRRWRDGAGRLRTNSRPGYWQWDQIETRLLCDQVVGFEDDVFIIGCGRVIWTHHGRDRRRWWMRHPARRRQS